MATCSLSSEATNTSTAATQQSLKCSRLTNTSGLCWQERLFGKQLLQCNQINHHHQVADTTSASALRDVSSVLGNESGSTTNNHKCQVIGVYFSFINSGGTCDEFTRQLIELYASVNSCRNNRRTNGEASSTRENSTLSEINDKQDSSDDDCRRKRFQVVHVVLWSNVTDVLDCDESFRNHVLDLPWLAVPNHDYERKVKRSYSSSIFLFF